MTPDELNKELLEAAKTGNAETVNLLIEAGAKVNAYNKFGKTPLHLAVICGHTDNVKALIEAGADINLQDDLEETALHKAAYNGLTKIAVSLIELGANINAKDKSGGTPLHQAAYKGHTDTVKALTAVKGVNLNSRDLQEETPLHWAARYGKTEIAEALIEAGANVNARNNGKITPLHWAARYGKTEIAEALIEAGANVNLKNNERKTALDMAKASGYEVYNKIINALAEKIKNNDEKRLAFAMGNHPRLGANSPISLIAGEPALIKKNIKEAEGMTLNNIEQKTHHEAVKKQLIILQPNKFVGSHDDLNKKLLEAAKAGNTEEVINALNEGADINAQNNIANSPLHLAARNRNGNTKTAQELIKAGADVNLQNNDGETPLHIAACYDHTKIGVSLIKAGADVNAKNNNNKTPLHLAAQFARTEIAETLIKAGADVNLQDKNRKTALDIAAACDNNKFYNQFIDVLAEKIKNNALTLKFKKGALKKESPISLIADKPALIAKITHEASLLMVDATISEGKHCDAVKERLHQLQTEQNAKEKTEAQSAKAGVNIDTTQVAAKKSATQTQNTVMNCLQKAANLFGEGLEGINNAFFPTEHRSHAKNVTESRSDPQQAKGVCSIS